jgi:hypothetical protein
MAYSRLLLLALPSSSICGIFWILGKTHPWSVAFHSRLHHDLIPFKELFWRHFAARAIGLIVIPLIVYLSFFWIHFTILTNSGTGDSFMSPQFQESLAGNELLMNSIGEVGFFPVPPCILNLPQSSSITIPSLCDIRIPRCSYTLIPNVTRCVMMMAGSVARVWRALLIDYLCDSHV